MLLNGYIASIILKNTFILLYLQKYHPYYIYLADRELLRCACFNNTKTAAGVIPSILFAAPCNPKLKEGVSN
jgi:hypothetical protein